MKRILRVLLILTALILLAVSRKSTDQNIGKKEILDSPKYKIPDELRYQLE